MSSSRSTAVLYVDDDSGVAETVAGALERADDRLTVALLDDPTPSAVVDRLEADPVHCLVTAYDLGATDGLAVLDAVTDASLEIPVVIYAGCGTEAIASEAIALGVDGYVRRRGDDDPEQTSVLVNRILTAVERRESTRRLETLVSNLPGMVYRARHVTGWPFEFVDGEVESLLGYEPAELEGGRVDFADQMIHPADRTRVWETVVDAVETDRPFELTYRIRTADGEQKWVWERGRAVTAPTQDGRVIEGIIVDVSSQKARQTNLERQEAIVGALVENLPVGVLVENADREVTVANGTFCATFDDDLDPDDLIGRDCAVAAVELAPLFADPDAFVDRTENVLAAREPVSEERLQLDDGRTLVRSYVPYDSPDGPANLWLYRDGTNRVEHERALEQYATRLESLLETTRTLLDSRTIQDVAEVTVQSIESGLDRNVATIWLTDDLVASHAGRAATDRDSEPAADQRESVSGPILTPVASTDRARALFDDFPTYSAGRDSLSWEAYERGSSRLIEDLRDYDSRAREESPIRSELIVPLGEYGLLNVGATDPGAFSDADVTLAELWASVVTVVFARLENQRELRTQKREVQRERDRLDQFASFLSHDLRNPLNVAAGNLEIARAEHDGETLGEVAWALDRIEQLVDDMLTLARQGSVVSETTAVDLRALVNRCWKHVDTASATIDVRTDLVIGADESRLAQALENLFRNAVEHGGRDVTITVGTLTEGPDGEVGFYVCDDGTGIPQADREAVFEGGYTTAGDGTGLGLAIVAEIVEAHGWDVRAVPTAESGGARFEITGVERLE